MFKKTANNNAPLADRVALLERELQKTREMIKADMERLIEMMKKER